MPITVKLSLLPEEAEALRDFADFHTHREQSDRALATQTVHSHLERALRYLHGACAHQIARYVPGKPHHPALREAGPG